jgi:hypothetical protein
MGLISELNKINLPNIKILLTGSGKVAKGGARNGSMPCPLNR